MEVTLYFNIRVRLEILSLSQLEQELFSIPTAIRTAVELSKNVDSKSDYNLHRDDTTPDARIV